MKGFKKFIFLFSLILTISMILKNQLIAEPTVQSMTNVLVEVAAVWEELAAATQAAMRYEQAYQQQLPQFFCGNCHKILYCKEFLEKMLALNIFRTATIVLLNANIYDNENSLGKITDLRPQFEKLKQLFVAGNSHDLVVFMLNALDKKKIVNLSCSACGSYAWKCAVAKPSIIVSSLQDNFEVCRS